MVPYRSFRRSGSLLLLGFGLYWLSQFISTPEPVGHPIALYGSKALAFLSMVLVIRGFNRLGEVVRSVQSLLVQSARMSGNICMLFLGVHLADEISQRVMDPSYLPVVSSFVMMLAIMAFWICVASYLRAFGKSGLVNNLFSWLLFAVTGALIVPVPLVDIFGISLLSTWLLYVLATSALPIGALCMYRGYAHPSRAFHY